MTASASAVTLRGIPQCHGENVEPTVRPRSASEGGMAQIPSLTSSCTASGPRRSASTAEREPVAAGTLVGDWDAAARRGNEEMSVAVLGEKTLRLAGPCKATSSCAVETSQGGRPSGESNGSAADPDACSARDGPSVQRPASCGRREAQAASRADRLTPSRVSWARRGWKTHTSLQLTASQAAIRCSA
ncbi:hypothetical protein TcYC6_0118560 [Trypanosoma cruzi]|nr:hypothetical protein TcYC6_0118560 [Trypanosoma cruzi]